MMEWFSNNIGTIMVTLVLAGIITAIILKLRKDKKQGKSTCGCNCKQCAMTGHCHPNIQKK